MIPFKTTKEEKEQISSIVAAMKTAGLTNEFINSAADYAQTDQGIFELMAFWHAAIDEDERAEIINDLQDLIDDYRLCP